MNLAIDLPRIICVLFSIFVARRQGRAASILGRGLSLPGGKKHAYGLAPESMPPVDRQTTASSACVAELNTSLVKFGTLASNSDGERMQVWQDNTRRKSIPVRPTQDAVGRAITIDIMT